VADLYHSFHPAVLQALAMVAEAARAEGKNVGICGELAGEPMGAVLLLAMGYDILSMNATSLPKVKNVLRNLHLAEARELLAQVMTMEDVADIQERMMVFLADHGMEKFIHSPVE
jgi:phosphotransferase system enzyme I (PtsP)